MFGFSNENPEHIRDVSNSSITKSFTVLSELSRHDLFRISSIMGFFGLISKVLLLAIYEPTEFVVSACAFIILSMLALHEYSEVTITHGELCKRSETTTLPTLSPNISLMTLVRL